MFRLPVQIQFWKIQIVSIMTVLDEMFVVVVVVFLANQVQATFSGLQMRLSTGTVVAQIRFQSVFCVPHCHACKKTEPQHKIQCNVSASQQLLLCSDVVCIAKKMSTH